MTSPPTVTVVIPTHRRPGSLLRVLEALDRQDVAAGTFEVVVVCDGLEDPSLSVVQDSETWSFPMRVVEQRNQGPAAARNRGVGLAGGDLIVFLDDDVVPSPGVIRAHVEAHGDAQDLVVVGPLLPPRGHGKPWIRFEGRTLEDQYRQMEAGRWSMTYRQFYTGNASVRRNRILEAGGFDETYLRAEDVELACRLHDRGARFHLAMDAIDRLPHAGSKGAYLKQQLQDKLIEHKRYIERFGQDLPEIRNWRWGAPNPLAPAAST